MASARKRHLAKQAFSNKLKTLRASLEGPETCAFVTIEEFGTGKPIRLKLKKFDSNELMGGEQLLAVVNGELRSLASTSYSLGGGSVHVMDHFFSGYIPYKQILAVVDREHAR